MNSQEFVDLISASGYTPKSYSGRGMFGDRCVSVNLDRNESASFGAMMMNTAAEEQKPFVERLLDKHSTDAMGMGIVMYWRGMDATGVKFPADVTEEEED